MRKEEILEIVNVMNQQLFYTAPLHIQMSWGVSERVAGVYEDMATLKLKVSGFEHKGWVFISYNEGLDLYEVRLFDENYQLVKTVEEVYFDQMGELIDTLVERGYDSDEQYFERVKKTYS